MKNRLRQLIGLILIEVLLHNIEDNEGHFVTEALVKEEHLKALVSATHEPLTLNHSYSDLLLLDYTYKTNRYGMPLLHFDACTPSKEYFSTAFCFQSGEAEEDYMCALKTFNKLVLRDIEQPDIVITDNCKALKTSSHEPIQTSLRCCVDYISMKTSTSSFVLPSC